MSDTFLWFMLSPDSQEDGETRHRRVKIGKNDGKECVMGKEWKVKQDTYEHSKY